MNHALSLEPSLLIYNISKPANIKCLLKNAVTFGCKTIFVAGQKNFSFDPNQDAEKKGIPSVLKPMMRSIDGKQPPSLSIVRFEKLEECVDYIHSLGITLVGIEIDESAQDVHAKDCFDAQTKVCFMMGNEGTGMNQKQMKLCDRFVKIRQYGGGTASLNVSIAAAIVLHVYRQYTLSLLPQPKALRKLNSPETIIDEENISIKSVGKTT